MAVSVHTPVRVRACVRACARALGCVCLGAAILSTGPEDLSVACVFFKARGPVAEKLDYLVKSAPLSRFSFGSDSLLELLLFLVVLFSIVVKYN